MKDEMLHTLMCEVEKILNDRPITPPSSDSRDPEPLTPSKILLLKSNSSVPLGISNQADNYGNRRFKQAQLFADRFWSRWIKEYVPLLQHRNKWFTSVCNLKVKDIVLLCEENVPRGKWPMGIVEEVYVGSDSLVRSVKVKTGEGYKVRPITKLCLLEQAM